MGSVPAKGSILETCKYNYKDAMQRFFYLEELKKKEFHCVHKQLLGFLHVGVSCLWVGGVDTHTHIHTLPQQGLVLETCG